MSITFPGTIKFTDILRTHPLYDEVVPELQEGKLTIHEDFYVGGSAFRARIEKYLDKRMLESDNVDFNAKSAGLAKSGDTSARERRKRISRYTPVATGKLEALNALTLQSQPRITEMPEDAGGAGDGGVRAAMSGKAPETYWHKLNDNANGAGADLTELAQDLVRNFMKFGRAYLMIKFPVKGQPYESKSQQVEAGEFDATLHSLSPKIVDDWKIQDGVIEYVRTHTIEDIPHLPWEETTGQRHVWIYYTKDATAKYQADVVNGADAPQLANLMETRPHDLGVVPVIPIRISPDLWLMERLRDPILAHFNRRASITWSLNQMGFSIFTLIGTDNQEEVSIHLDPESEALVLKSGSAQFVAPSAAVWAALSADEEKMEKAMDDAIQTAALAVASRDSSGRQSGVAKFREFGSLTNLLTAYGMGLRNIFEEAIRVIKKAREESKDILLEGLDKFDIQSLDLRTKQAQDVLPLSKSETFTRWMMQELLLAHAKDAPPAIRKKIIEEVQDANMSKPEAPKGSGDPMDTDPGRDGKGKVVEDTYKERTV